MTPAPPGFRTPFCRRLGLTAPVVQAPVGRDDTDLAAAVSNAAGLGTPRFNREIGRRTDVVGILLGRSGCTSGNQVDAVEQTVPPNVRNTLLCAAHARELREMGLEIVRT